MSHDELDVLEVYGEKDTKVGILAWLFTLIALIGALFIVLDWQNASEVYMVATLQLGLGLAGAAMMGYRPDLESIKGQSSVLIFGLLGGGALMVIGSVINLLGAINPFSVSDTNTTLAILAPVSEEYIFTLVIFGSLWQLGKALKELFWIRFVLAGVPSSLIFAGWHYWVIGTSLLPVMVLFCGSLLLKFLFAKSGDIGAPMLAHLLNNVIVTLPTIEVWVSTYWWFFAIPIILFIVLIYIRRKY